MNRDDTYPSEGDPFVRPFLREFVPSGAEPLQPLDDTVRPFLVTQGRTTGLSSIAIEAQVMVTAFGRDAVDSLAFEYRDIVCLVEEPLAVAEIAARLRLHLGVTRVLLGDLQERGMVSTFTSDVSPADDVEMIQRVIDELRQRS